MTNIENKPHYKDIDFAKAVGILLVLIGHSFPDASSGSISFGPYKAVFDVIYSFHMPLFFFLSGFVSTKAKSAPGDYIKDRFLRLMVPYFVVGLVYMPVKLLLNGFANRPYEIDTFWQILIGNNPNGGLWFLYNLFVIQVLMRVVFWYTKDSKNLLLAAMGMLLAYTNGWIPKTGGNIDTVPYYFFFTVAGLCYREYYGKAVFQKWTTVAAVSVCAISAVVAYRWGGERVMMIPSAILCTAAVMLIMRKIQDRLHDKIQAVLRFLSDYSMDIYICHGIIMAAVRILCWSLLKLNYHVVVLLMFAAGLFGSILVSKYILRPVKVLKKLVLGMK